MKLNDEDFKKCGIGQGAKCCIFLCCGVEGFECLKAGVLHELLVRKQPTMSAKRMPDITTPFPQCQVEEIV